ncbi:MAG: orotate phosphoribosyltransferase [Candidatus Babeliales bacterium]
MIKYSFKFTSYLLFINFMYPALAHTNTKNDLIKQLYDIGVFKFGNFTLKSGKSSSFYIDMRKIISHPQIVLHLVECMKKVMDTCDYDCLCGVPYSGLVIATAASITYQKPMILKRKEAKAYGTQKMVEGIYQAGNRCLVIEDVITTGQSIIETTTVLEQEGLYVKDIIILIDREESGVEYVAQKGYQVHALFTVSEIAQHLYNLGLICISEFEQILNS